MATGWEAFLEKLAQPGLQSAMLQLGTQLLQPIKPGQSTAGALGSALSNTMASYAAQKAKMQEKEERKKEKEQDLELKKRQLDIQEKQGDTLNEIRKQQLENDRQKLELEKTRIANDTSLTEAQKQKLLNDIKVQEKKLGLEEEKLGIAKEKVEVEKGKAAAQTDLYSAQADYYREKAKRGGADSLTGTAAVLDTLARAYQNTGAAESYDEAYKKAAAFWKSTKNLSPEQAELSVFNELLKSAILPTDPKERAAQIESLQETAKKVVEEVFNKPSAESGGVTGTGAEQAPNLDAEVQKVISQEPKAPGQVVKVNGQARYISVGKKWVPVEALAGTLPQHGAPSGNGTTPGQKVLDVDTGMVYIWNGVTWQPEGAIGE